MLKDWGESVLKSRRLLLEILTLYPQGLDHRESRQLEEPDRFDE